MEEDEIKTMYTLTCLPSGMEEKLIEKVQNEIYDGVSHRELFEELIYVYRLSDEISTYIVDTATSRIQMEIIDNDDLKQKILEEKANGTWWTSLEEFYEDYEEMSNMKKYLDALYNKEGAKDE